MTVTIAKSSAETPPTILCADDRTLVGDALAKIFITAGYTVERAANGEEAWQKFALRRHKFDVVIADHKMPGVNGLQLVGQLRDAKFCGRIIVYGSSLTNEDTRLYQEMGVDAIVVERTDTAQLLGIMKAFHRQN